MIAILASVLLLARPTPLPQGHAHNDYAQPEPFYGAIRRGFCSIEADVFLVDGKLLVGHDRSDLKPDRNLKQMYLEPLAKEVKTHHGSVYGVRQEVTLLVDIKADGPAVYAALRKQLAPYRGFLTRYRDGRITHRAVMVVLSGERPTDILAGERERYAFIDGRLEDLGRSDSSLVPLISDAWNRAFSWNGVGEMPITEGRKLRDLVNEAHRQGQKVRFWATPESSAAWTTLYDAGVDLIGSDDQDALASFLRSR